MSRKLLALLVLIPAAGLAAQQVQPTAPAPELVTRHQTAAVKPVSTPPAGPAQYIIPAGTQMPVAASYTINGRSARVGDRVDFVTTVPVDIDNHIIIPVGSYVQGKIAAVKHASHFHRTGTLRLSFERILLPNGYSVNLLANMGGAPNLPHEDVHGEGTITSRSDTGKNVGRGAAAGATTGAETGVIVGAAQRSITGGLESAAVGTALGAGVGAAVGALGTVFTRGHDVEIPRGATVNLILQQPVAIPADRVDFRAYQAARIPEPERSSNRRRRDSGIMRPPIPF